MAVKDWINRRRAPQPPPLTPEDIRAIIDTQARKHLGMSGDEFVERWRRHELPDTPVAFDLGILASALEPDGTPLPNA